MAWKDENIKTWVAKDTQRLKARLSGYVRLITTSVKTADFMTEGNVDGISSKIVLWETRNMNE